MTEANGGYLGVSPPLSTDPPKPRDNELNDLLMHELKAQNNFESQEDSQKRSEVLQKLQKLLVQLVQKVGKKKGLNPEILKQAGGRIYTYGSYRLGVYGPGSDIDALMVAPKHVKRDDFFEHMPDMIRQSVTPEELTELVPVPGISVPIIKLEMAGISIDLIFCSLQRDSVPMKMDLADNELLRGLDETDLRCVNGTRVTDRILTLVPQTRVFRIALRAVKIWAQKRAIYGNVVGFPGGVAYAMMVARICQLYPKAAAPAIVAKFFWVIKNWQWPSPIYLQAREKGPLNEREWDPVGNNYDRRHLMPIITPAYPCMNSTHNITPSTKAVLLQELGRGHEIMTDIYAGKKPWSALFEKHCFFTSAYQHYIVVITASKTKEAQQAWSGLVQSKLRRLIMGIEQSDADTVKLVQPFNKGVERHHQCNNSEEVDKTLHGSLEWQIEKPKMTEESADVKMQAAAQGDANVISDMAAADGVAEEKEGEKQEIWSTTFYLGIELNKGQKNLDISWPVTDFKRIATEWDSYNENIHSIQIKYHRDYQLPDDLFTQGETKPVKKKKNKGGKAAPADTADKKRSFNNTGLDENQDPAKRRQSGTTPGAAAKPNGNAVPNGAAG